MATEWYLQIGGDQYGPYTSGQVKEYAAEGRIVPDSILKQGAAGSWTQASSVRGLFASTLLESPAAPSDPTAIVPPSLPIPQTAATLPQPAPSDAEFVLQPAAVTRTARPPVTLGVASGLVGSLPPLPSRPRAEPTNNSVTRIVVIVAVVLALGFFGTLSYRARFAAGMQKGMQEEADRISKTLPKQIDEFTQLDSVNVGTNLTCTYSFTLSVKLNAEQKRKFQSEMTQTAKADRDFVTALEHGAIFHYIYHDENGQLILEFDIKD